MRPNPDLERLPRKPLRYFRSEIGDQVPEPVDLQDYAGPLLRRGSGRLGEVEAHVVANPLPESGRRHARRQVCSNWSKDVSAVKSLTHRLAEIAGSCDFPGLM